MGRGGAGRPPPPMQVNLKNRPPSPMLGSTLPRPQPMMGAPSTRPPDMGGAAAPPRPPVQPGLSARPVFVPPPGSERTAPKRRKAPTDPPTAMQSRAAPARQRPRTHGQHTPRGTYDSQPAQGRLIIPSPTVTTDEDAEPGSNCGTVTLEDRRRVEQALEREYDDDGRACLSEFVEECQEERGDGSVSDLLQQATAEGTNLLAPDVRMVALRQYAERLFLLMPMYALAKLYYGKDTLRTRVDEVPPAKVLKRFSNAVLRGNKGGKPFSSVLISAVYSVEHFLLWACEMDVSTLHPTPADMEDFSDFIGQQAKEAGEARLAQWRQSHKARDGSCSCAKDAYGECPPPPGHKPGKTVAEAHRKALRWVQALLFWDLRADEYTIARPIPVNYVRRFQAVPISIWILCMLEILAMDPRTPLALANVACGIIFLCLASARCAQANNLVFHGIDDRGFLHGTFWSEKTTGEPSAFICDSRCILHGDQWVSVLQSSLICATSGRVLQGSVFREFDGAKVWGASTQLNGPLLGSRLQNAIKDTIAIACCSGAQAPAPQVYLPPSSHVDGAGRTHLCLVRDADRMDEPWTGADRNFTAAQAQRHTGHSGKKFLLCVAGGRGVPPIHQVEISRWSASDVCGCEGLAPRTAEDRDYMTRTIRADAMPRRYGADARIRRAGDIMRFQMDAVRTTVADGMENLPTLGGWEYLPKFDIEWENC